MQKKTGNPIGALILSVVLTGALAPAFMWVGIAIGVSMWLTLAAGFALVFLAYLVVDFFDKPGPPY